MKSTLSLFLLLTVFLGTGCQAQQPSGDYYEILTPQGRMVILVYDATPGHRDNFRKLVAEQYYDGTTFHRVMPNFMIQGGDPNSKDENPYNDGQGDPGYKLPAEFVDGLYHKRGALAAARQPDQVNPERASSGSQFYIVHGRTWSEEELASIAQRNGAVTRNPNFTFTDEQRQVYMNEGGTPFLDGQYTVFGELVEGPEVVEVIATVPTSQGNRPLENVTMTIRPLPDYTPAEQ